MIRANVGDRLGHRRGLSGCREAHVLREVRGTDEERVDALDRPDGIDKRPACSSSTQRSECALAALANSATKSVMGAPMPHAFGRVPAANPRRAPGPNLTPAMDRRASSPVLMCGICTPITPGSMTDWMSLAQLVL